MLLFYSHWNVHPVETEQHQKYCILWMGILIIVQDNDSGPTNIFNYAALQKN